MIGNAMRISARIHFFDTVIDPNGDHMLPGTQVCVQFIGVGCCQTVLHSDSLIIYPQLGFPVRPFQMKGDLLIVPILWYDHFFLIPRSAQVFKFGL